MIKLTRLNGEEFVVNAELIRYVEGRPDTYVTLTSTERFVVKEPVAEVVRRAIAYARAVRACPRSCDVWAFDICTSDDWAVSADSTATLPPAADRVGQNGPTVKSPVADVRTERLDESAFPVSSGEFAPALKTDTPKMMRASAGSHC